MLMKLTPGVNFINTIQAAFMSANPKSVKKTVKLSIYLCFWDLCSQKTDRTMLMKSTPGTNFINMQLLRVQIPKAQKNTVNLTVFLHFRDLRIKKPAC